MIKSYTSQRLITCSALIFSLLLPAGDLLGVVVPNASSAPSSYNECMAELQAMQSALKSKEVGMIGYVASTFTPWPLISYTDAYNEAANLVSQKFSECARLAETEPERNSFSDAANRQISDNNDAMAPAKQINHYAPYVQAGIVVTGGGAITALSGGLGGGLLTLGIGGAGAGVAISGVGEAARIYDGYNKDPDQTLNISMENVALGGLIGGVLGPLTKCPMCLKVLAPFGVGIGTYNAYDNFSQGNTASGLFHSATALLSTLPFILPANGSSYAPKSPKPPTSPLPELPKQLPQGITLKQASGGEIEALMQGPLPRTTAKELQAAQDAVQNGNFTLGHIHRLLSGQSPNHPSALTNVTGSSTIPKILADSSNSLYAYAGFPGLPIGTYAAPRPIRWNFLDLWQTAGRGDPKNARTDMIVFLGEARNNFSKLTSDWLGYPTVLIKQQIKPLISQTNNPEYATIRNGDLNIRKAVVFDSPNGRILAITKADIVQTIQGHRPGSPQFNVLVQRSALKEIPSAVATSLGVLGPAGVVGVGSAVGIVGGAYYVSPLGNLIGDKLAETIYPPRP
jgi:hypothetical protein